MLYGTVIPGLGKPQPDTQFQPLTEQDLHVVVITSNFCSFRPTSCDPKSVERIHGLRNATAFVFLNANLSARVVLSTASARHRSRVLNSAGELVHDYTRFCVRLFRSQMKRLLLLEC